MKTEKIRLNKFLASCGLGSRRSVEALIEKGVVRINGKPIDGMGVPVDPIHDKITVEGKRVAPATRLDYILMNKPKGYDVTRGGRHHHRRAHDLLPKDTHASVQSVGRLDRNSTGLLLFTNDGELAQLLMHPRYGCEKTYVAHVEGDPSKEILRQLTEGVELDDGPAQAVKVSRLPAEAPLNPEGRTEFAILKIVMNEGRNRIVRRMCDAIGHPVLELTRIEMGSLKLGTLGRGKTRPLTPAEVGKLKKHARALLDKKSGQGPNAPKKSN